MQEDSKIRVSGLLIVCDSRAKEVHVRDPDDTYYGTTLSNPNDIDQLIGSLIEARTRIFGARKGNSQ